MNLNLKTVFENKKAKWKERPKKQKKKVIRNCVIGVVVVAVGVGAFFGYQKIFGGGGTASAQTARVTRGSVSKTIEGSGTIEAVSQYNVTSLTKGEIVADYFEEGQEVQKGDLLYEIDSSDADSSIKNAENSLKKSQLSYEESLKTLNDLTVTAPITGVITTLYVKNGDTIQNGAKVAEIVNSEQMLLAIDFNSADAANIHTGEGATVKIENSFDSLWGTVTKVASGSMPNGDGVSVTSVEITVTNPGGLAEGDKATAVIGSYACNSAGTFSYSGSQTVSAKASGEVSGLSYDQGDRVSAGSRLISISSDSANSSVRQSQLSLEQSQNSLADANKKLEDYKITAPITGKVISKNAKAGDKIETGSSSTGSSASMGSTSSSNSAMAVIADLSSLVFEISVDELDISNITEGQTVEITADAVEGKTYTGRVDNVSIIGTATNGVTSYPVKVVIDGENTDGLIPGMNVSAKIVVESRENVLRVPVSAVQRGNTVVVKSTGSDTGQNENAEKNSPPDFDGMPGGENGTPPEDFTPPEGFTPPDGMQQDDGGERTAPVARSAASTGNSTGRNSSSGSTQGRAQRTSTTGGEPAQAGTGNKAASTKQDANVPDGYKTVQVVVGLSDGDFVEIISGLSEGDTVLLPDKTTSTSSSSSQQNGMPGGMGGMGGGMPSGGGGGMPGGGGGMPGGMR